MLSKVLFSTAGAVAFFARKKWPLPRYTRCESTVPIPPQKNKDIRSKPYEGKMEISPWVESGERLRCRGWKLTWANTKLREKFNKTQLEDTSILAHSGTYNFIQEIVIHTKTGRYLHQSFPRGRKMFEIDTLNNYEFYWLSDHRTKSCFSFLT